MSVTTEVIVPIVIALVTTLGSGALIKVFTERSNRNAEAKKTLTEGEVTRSAEDREWVRQARTEAAEARAEVRALEVRNRELEQKIDELGDELRALKLQLAHCPGGALCPMKPTPTA